jgi:uncharacterized membrane protein
LKIKVLNGILIVDILSALLLISIVFVPSTVARTILGLPFLLFFPGYTMVTAFFAKKSQLSKLERIVLSGVMSIAVVGLIGVGLNYTSWGIRLTSAFYSITAFIFMMSVIALIRRSQVLGKHVLTMELNFDLAKFRQSMDNKPLSIILVIAIFAALGVLGYKIAVPNISKGYAEFYILGMSGKAQDYPTDYKINNAGNITQVTYSGGTIDTIHLKDQVIIGIINREKKTTAYYVKMEIDNEPVKIYVNGTSTDILGPIELQQDKKWENVIGIVPQHIGDNQKVELLLLSGLETTPEDSLSFWVNVKNAPVESLPKISTGDKPGG